jgi:hypothetical protein
MCMQRVSVAPGATTLGLSKERTQGGKVRGKRNRKSITPIHHLPASSAYLIDAALPNGCRLRLRLRAMGNRPAATGAMDCACLGMTNSKQHPMRLGLAFALADVLAAPAARSAMLQAADQTQCLGLHLRRKHRRRSGICRRFRTQRQ